MFIDELPRHCFRSSAGEVGIFENFKVHHWLGDFKKEERRAKVQTAGIIKGEWIGKL